MKLIWKILLVIVITIVWAIITCGGNLYLSSTWIADMTLGRIMGEGEWSEPWFVFWQIEIITIFIWSIILVNRKIKNHESKITNTAIMSNKARTWWAINIFVLTFWGTIWLLYASWIDYMVQSFFSLGLFWYMLGIWCIVTLVQNPYFFDQKKKVSTFLFLLLFWGSRLFSLLQVFSFWYENINIISYWANLWVTIIEIPFGWYLFLAWFKENRISQEKLQIYWNYFWGALLITTVVLPFIIRF